MPDVEHLKLIQAVVGRLAGNSFLLKGWTVTLVAGLTAFAKADTNGNLAWIAVGVVVVFAFLDSYCLAQERAYPFRRRPGPGSSRPSTPPSACPSSQETWNAAPRRVPAARTVTTSSSRPVPWR